jgi:thioesterase domain-containing protein/acyl carrier protein
MLRMLTETGWSGDKDLEIWTGGEPTAAAVIRYVAPRVRALCNYYGPTEATVQVTVARLGPDDIDSPVGVAREHVGCVVLDPGGRPTAVGEIGELFITGTALARGYLNNPDLTAERFAPKALDGGPSERAYRTGDLARIRADGSLVIVGRVDDQIKLRGYRIEPREIELRLMEHPQIIDAVVLALQPSEMAEPRLVAFVKCSGEVAVRSARDFVRETLPDYMVPTVLVEVDQFPLTPNGKVDKRQLAELSAGDGARPLAGIDVSSGDRPASELERSVLDLFATVLAVDVDGLRVDDDYFDLGGTSLGSVRLFMLIEERYGVRLTPSTLVSAPTARLLASVISRSLLAGRPPSTVHEPPRYEWERVLCNLWAETLGVRDVGRSDNFFDLGGSAAEALRMIEQLKTTYGTQVTLAELYRAPTVSQLAELTGGRSVRSNLVALNTTGHKTPFFCIAGAGGLALNFLALARQLGSEQPFYGLQAQGIECRALPDFTLSQAAARHAKAIREVQPHGPYLIGGHSLGGVLALKVVQRLAADGEDVALLAVFDTVLTKRMIGVKIRGASVAGGRAGRWRLFNDRTKLSTILHLPVAGLVAQRGIAQFELFGLHDTIQARFARRLRPWAGLAVLYASDDGKSAGIDSGWGHLLTGQWSCVTVPGDHLSIMQRPNVDELASNLGDQMTRALASCEVARSDLGKSADVDDRGDAGNDVP